MINITRFPQQMFIHLIFTLCPGHNTYWFNIVYLESDVSVAFDPSLIECSLGGNMVIDDSSHTYSHGMIEGLMIF